MSFSGIKCSIERNIVEAITNVHVAWKWKSIEYVKADKAS